MHRNLVKEKLYRSLEELKLGKNGYVAEKNRIMLRGFKFFTNYPHKREPHSVAYILMEKEIGSSNLIPLSGHLSCFERRKKKNLIRINLLYPMEMDNNHYQTLIK